MDEDYYVPIELIEGFKRVRKLNVKREDIITVSQQSKIVHLSDDQTKIKPNLHVCFSHALLITIVV